MFSSNSKNEVIVSVRGVSKHFPDKLTVVRLLRYLLPWRSKPSPQDFQALCDIDFELRRGEVVGLVGKNGSGKSTLLQIIAGLMGSDSGTVDVGGRISALLELGAGFNPEFTGRENIFLSGAIYGLSRTEIEERFDKIVEFADIGDHLLQPVKTYSSGMFARLAFAVAIQVDPDIILVDEILSVGDVAFQAKCFQKIEELRDQGSSIIMVSHDMNSVRMFCDKAYLLHNGRMVCSGKPADVTDEYLRLMMAERDAQDSGVAVVETVAGGNPKAWISDIEIFDASGATVTKPVARSRCRVRYFVNFDRAVEHPIVTVQLKTMMGLVVADVSSEFSGTRLPACAAGDRLKVVLDMTLNTCPGPYRLGVSIAERSDAGDLPICGIGNIVLDIIAGDSAGNFGIVDVDPDLKVEWIGK